MINDPKLLTIMERLNQQEEKTVQHYKLHGGVLFIKATPNHETWRLVVTKNLEQYFILDYHGRYGHMGLIKVVKALEEHIYIKGINKNVRLTLRKCRICQLVKVNNQKREGELIPRITIFKLEKVYIFIYSIHTQYFVGIHIH